MLGRVGLMGKKTMLSIVDSIFTVSIDFITYAFFEDFGNYARKGNGSIIFDTALVPFFMNWYDIYYFLFIWQRASAKGYVK